jgi:hypothetical protein
VLSPSVMEGSLQAPYPSFKLPRRGHFFAAPSAKKRSTVSLANRVGDGCPDIRPRTSFAILAVVPIGSFHYPTHEFSSYHGGEIPLQAAAPWLVLAAYHIPETGALPAALARHGRRLLAFCLAAALIAGGMVSLAFGRG